MWTSTWKLSPPQHQTCEKGHGRIEERKIWTSVDLNGYLQFPFVGQVFQIERTTYTVVTGKTSVEIVQGITSCSPTEASPARVLGLNRDHWGVEALHHVRDRTFDEDRSQIRKGSAPQVFATLKNLAISLFRLARIGDESISSAVQHCNRKVRTTLRFIGLS